jgi:ribosomal protein S28E/S33
VLTRLLADDVIDRAMDRLDEAGAAQRIVQRLLDDGIAEQVAERVLAGPEAERLLATALRGPLVEEAVTELLETRAIWILVDEIARSPAVTEAITQQGTGFLDLVAEGARDRSRHADARVQKFADRLLRRRPKDEVALPTELLDEKPR